MLVEPATLPADATRPWAPVTRLLFRLVVAYFTIYVITTQMLGSLLPLPVGGVPELQTLPPIRTLISWVAVHVFRVTSPLVITGSGSGDKTFDWVHAFCVLVVSLGITAVWTAMDRRRSRYDRLDAWFRLFARFALATTMISYGMDKAVPLQMPSPSLARLLEPYGNFSPMGVLWASVGASRSYEILVGFAELAGGVLLFVPRTATLGALICLFDTLQIFTLNMTYDIPVKLFAFHLIVLSLFLVAPQARQLLAALGLGPAVALREQPPLARGRRAVRILVAVQIAFGLYVIAVNAYGARAAWVQYGGGAPKSPLYGIWNVESMSIDGHIRSPLLTDYDRWRRVVFDRPGSMSFQRMNDSFVFFAAKIDQPAGTIALTPPNEKSAMVLRFQRPATDRLVVDGEMSQHAIHMELHLVDRGTFLLVNRGFHWIQEYPFNR